MMDTRRSETTPDTILRLTDVRKRTGIRRSTLYNRIAKKEFPHQVSLGGRAVGWLKREVDEWVSERMHLRPGRRPDSKPLYTNWKTALACVPLHFNVCQLLVKTHDGAVIEAAHAVSLERLQYLHHDGRQWQRYADFVAGFEDVCNVLEIRTDPASGIEFPVQHQRGFGIQDRASGQSATDCFVHQLRIHARFGRHHQRFRDRGNIQLNNDLICELGYTAGSAAAGQHRGRPHRFEDWQHFIKIRLGSASHDGKSAVDSLGFAAADRRVQHPAALLSARFRNLPTDDWGDRTHVHDNRALVRAFNHSILADR